MLKKLKKLKNPPQKKNKTIEERNWLAEVVQDLKDENTDSDAIRYYKNQADELLGYERYQEAGLEPYRKDFLMEYYQAIQSGEEVVGMEMLINLENLIDERESGEYIWDTTEAAKRMWFDENCIRLTKSPFYGKPMTLMLFQKAMIQCFYSFKMLDRLDRFKELMSLRSRKNGKSEEISAIILGEFFLGPDGADLVCSSNDENQASILYEAIDVMRLMIDPDQKCTWRNQKGMKNLLNGSKIFKMSDRTKNKEGRNIDFGAIDEEHEMKDNTIVKSIQQSQSLKLNPKLIHITTEGFVNDGFLDKELIKARKILHREDSGAAARRYLPWLYTQDSEEEIWRDENSWRKSNPSLGTIKRFEYLREQVDLAGQYRADRVFVLAKDFNIKQATATSWLDLEDYNYESYFDPEEFRGALCLGFVDLAMTTDLVVAKLMFMKPGDDNKYIVTRYFIPESKLIDSDDKGAGADYKQWAKEGHIQICEGNDVDVALVADWFYKLYKKYKFRLYKCGYDQKFSMEFRKKMDDYGFDYEVVMQNAVTLTNAYKILEGDLKARRTIYSSNPVDRWCLGNAAIKLVGDLGHFLVVKKDNPEERIDGAVAFGGLYEMYRRYRNEVFPKRK